MNVGTAVAVEGKPLSAGPSTSLLPIQTVANVGFTSIAFCTIVSPPRMSSVKPLAAGPTAGVGSADAAPGTATLLMIGVTELARRSAHVVGVEAGCPDSVTRAEVRRFVNGGAHPGISSEGIANRVPI